MAGVQPVTIYRTKWKGRFFGLSSESIEVIASVRRGWILGILSGQYTSQGEGSTPNVHRVRGLTALLDVDKGVFTPVEPYLESFKQKDEDFFREHNWEITGWIQVAEAVRQLIALNHQGVQNVFTRRIPSKHDNPTRRGQALASRSGFIQIEEGKEPGRVYEIHKEALSIGRDPQMFDIFLEDPLVGHARVINPGNGNYTVEGSHVKVNGQQLDDRQPYLLQEGDRIQLGQTVFAFGMK